MKELLSLPSWDWHLASELSPSRVVMKWPVMYEAAVHPEEEGIKRKINTVQEKFFSFLVHFPLNLPVEPKKGADVFFQFSSKGQQ